MLKSVDTGSPVQLQYFLVWFGPVSGSFILLQPMEKKTKFLPAAVLCTLALIVVGCSRGPSEADIRAALEKDMAKTAQSIDEAGKIFGGVGKALTDSMGKTELHAVRKIDCKEAKDAPGFVCDVEIDMTVPFVGRSKEMTTARFVKGPEGWVVMK